MRLSLRGTYPVVLLIVAMPAIWMLSSPFGVLGQDETPVEFTFNFGSDAEGWITGFADLPVDYDQSIYELHHEHGPLPDGLEGSGIYVKGHNRSDDLFMFLKRRVDGLRPNTEYAVSMSIDLATNVPEGLIGIGGSPGGSVFVKAGASTTEPVALEDGKGYLRMNIDKGNQSRGGEAMAVLGNVAHADVLDREYRIKTLDSADLPLGATTDGQGRVWLVVGTDSGFEGLTGLYYARVSYTLKPVEPTGSVGSPTTQPTATVAPTPTTEPAATVAPTPMPDPTPTVAPTPTTEPTATVAPTATAQPTAIREPTATLEPGPTPSPTPAPEPTTVPEPTPEPTATPLPEPTPSAGLPAVPVVESEGGSTFPVWLIVVLALAGSSIAAGAALAIWRRRAGRRP